MILAGDVGGTNCRMALFGGDGETFVTGTLRIYPSQAYSSLGEIIDDFMTAEKADVDKAAFGVAGPVLRGRVKVSNLDWVVDSGELASKLGIGRVVLANDLEATAYGIASLSHDDFKTLNDGEPDPEGNEALIAAGTGLGEAGLHWEGASHRPIRSEGGHVDYAPRSETEIELLRYLRREHDRVSYERVLSGSGLFNIYRFLRDTGRFDEPSWLADEMREDDPPRVVTRHGLSWASELCVRSVDLFVSVYGAEAGNLALKMVATGGCSLAAALRRRSSRS